MRKKIQSLVVESKAGTAESRTGQALSTPIQNDNNFQELLERVRVKNKIQNAFCELYNFLKENLFLY